MQIVGRGDALDKAKSYTSEKQNKNITFTSALSAKS